MKKPRIMRPDAKGRVTLGKLAKGVSSFRATRDRNGCIILEPYVEIPARDLGGFSSYINNETE